MSAAYSLVTEEAQKYYAQNCTGDDAAVMDADIQDLTSQLPEIYEALQSGEYDSVATWRVSREGEPLLRSFFARRFYRLMNKISDTRIEDDARDFWLMIQQMVDATLSMTEYNRFFKGIFSWVGFRTKWLFWKLFLYS